MYITTCFKVSAQGNNRKFYIFYFEQRDFERKYNILVNKIKQIKTHSISYDIYNICISKIALELKLI